MAIYVSLVFLVLGLVALAWGNRSDRRFALAVIFVALAAMVMTGSVVRSLWLYPLGSNPSSNALGPLTVPEPSRE